MSDPEVTCPNCNTSFKLNETLAAPLIQATAKQYEKKLAEQREAITEREAAVDRDKTNLEAARDAMAAQITAQVASKLDQERVRIAATERERAQEVAASDLAERDQKLADLNDVLKQREAKLQEAQDAQAELIRARRELDDQKRELALTIEKQVQASLGVVREKAKAEAEEGMTLKVRERDEMIAGMQRQIEDLKRKAEQGSQQLQGEVAELILEEALRERFPGDQIVPVPKGAHGGDCLQHVVGPDGQLAGTILWESKRTKAWSDGWLGKLRADQRAANADLALIISHTLPTGLEHFDLVDSVWVTHPRCAFAVATALRETLISLSRASRASEGQETKTELVYRYLTGSRFKHHVEAIVEQFTDMQADLEQERRTMTRRWAKREGQIRGVVDATAGMWGDLQGIAGASLQEIEGLGMPLLDGPSSGED